MQTNVSNCEWIENHSSNLSITYYTDKLRQTCSIGLFFFIIIVIIIKYISM